MLSDTLSGLVDITGGVLSAIDQYNSLASGFRANAIIRIYNYADLTLAGNKNFIGSGLTTQLPDIIKAGTVSGVTLYQNMPLQGTQGLISYSLLGNLRLYIYTSVDQQIAGREENKLGICLKEITDEDSLMDAAFLLRLTGLSGGPGCLGIHDRFSTNPKTLQCCVRDYCLQATMTSSHHANVTVRLLPRRLYKYWIPREEIVQMMNRDDLDQILSVPETCFGGLREDEFDEFATTEDPWFEAVVGGGISYTKANILMVMAVIIVFL